jgi:GrpB-like predicted nucleotidyltransferase (UPF0157 family)
MRRAPVGQVSATNIVMENFKKSITLPPYDPKWPEIFEGEAAQIKQALHNNCITLHHIGSTSVLGLVAKPVIDIIAVVKNCFDTRKPLESLGYTYKGEYNIPFRAFFSKKEGLEVHLHAYEEGSPDIGLHLLFRDFLRTHPEARAEYTELKKHLLTQESSYEKNNAIFKGYTLGKNPFIQKILKQAGFEGVCFRICTHHREWEAYHQLHGQKSNTPLSQDNHSYFVLYHGTDIVAAAHVVFVKEKKAVIESLKTQEDNKRYSSTMTHLIDTWVQTKDRHLIEPLSAS